MFACPVSTLLQRYPSILSNFGLDGTNKCFDIARMLRLMAVMDAHSP